MHIKATYTRKLLVYLFAVCMLLPLVFLGCQAQRATNLDRVQSFLGEVLQLDMAYYESASGYPPEMNSDLNPAPCLQKYSLRIPRNNASLLHILQRFISNLQHLHLRQQSAL